MSDPLHSTLVRADKGPVAPPPLLEGDLQRVVEGVTAWPQVSATVHWHFADQTRVDGVDFYVGEDELGHFHLDGSIHLATSPALCAQMVAEGVGRPFPYAHGWVEAHVDSLGESGAVRLFRRNYDRLRPPASGAAPSVSAPA